MRHLRTPLPLPGSIPARIRRDGWWLVASPETLRATPPGPGGVAAPVRVLSERRP